MADAIPRPPTFVEPDNADADARERARIARLRIDDREAFALLVEHYLERVTRFAYYIVRSHDAAEDLAQMVFVQLWEQRATIDPARSLKPYLLRAVRNRALNERKALAIRDRYRERIQAEAAAGSMPAVVPSFEGTVLSAATVQAAMRGLPERRRLAVRLRFSDALTYAEIGEVLEISAEAAEKLVIRALRELRRMLEVSG